MLLGQPVRQIAYFVDDVRKAAEDHHRLFGSGPFFLIEDIRQEVTYRGEKSVYHHSAAFGQWGEMQVELMQSLSSGPNILHELYPEGSGRHGLHHVALIVDDIEASVAEFNASGFPEAMRAFMPEMDMTVVLADTVERYGHFVELYPAVPKILDFYDMVKAAAQDFDGKDLIRTFEI